MAESKVPIINNYRFCAKRDESYSFIDIHYPEIVLDEDAPNGGKIVCKDRVKDLTYSKVCGDLDSKYSFCIPNGH